MHRKIIVAGWHEVSSSAAAAHFAAQTTSSTPSKTPLPAFGT